MKKRRAKFVLFKRERRLMSTYFYVFMVVAMIDHWTQIYIGEAYTFLWVCREGIYALLPLATNSKKNIVGSRISIVPSTQQ